MWRLTEWLLLKKLFTRLFGGFCLFGLHMRLCSGTGNLTEEWRRMNNFFDETGNSIPGVYWSWKIVIKWLFCCMIIQYFHFWQHSCTESIKSYVSEYVISVKARLGSLFIYCESVYYDVHFGLHWHVYPERTVHAYILCHHFYNVCKVNLDPQAAANYFFWLARWFLWRLAVASQVFSMAGWLESNMAG